MTEQLSKVAIQDKIEEQARTVRVRSLDLSFTEISTMYERDDLRIQPDYQRAFRWSLTQQSQFIESLILEIPIPPIYFAETEESNVFELVDGLQRLSSVLHFWGMLPMNIVKLSERYIDHLDDDDSDQQPIIEDELQDNDQEKSPGFKLEGCDIVPSLNGLTYEELPLSTQRHLRYSSIRVLIVRKESPRDIKYALFKRLNRGGSMLSDQEVRNSTVRQGNPEIIEFIEACAKNEDFRVCASSITTKKKNEKYDEELVLRFFSYKNNLGGYVHDIGPFLDDYIESIAGLRQPVIDFSYHTEREIFDKIFALLNAACGSDIFRAFGGTAFRSLLFEAICLGVLSHIDNISLDVPEHVTALKEAIEALKADKRFQSITTGGGKNSSKKLIDRIEYARDFVGERLPEVDR